jgi:hypothetical protein
MTEQMKLQLRAIHLITNAGTLAVALSFLRNGRRDLAIPLFEMEPECQNVAKAVDYLKRRQRPLALESLETELDQRVVALGTLPDGLESPERERLTECLRSIRDYRRENPRRFEADLGYFNKELLDIKRDLWDRAEKILNQIPEI